MNDDQNKWKGSSGPLPGKNARSNPSKPSPKPDPAPAAKPSKREWRPGDLPSSPSPPPGINARSDPGTPAPQPGPEPAAKPSKRDCRPGDLPSSQPQPESAARDARPFDHEQPPQHQQSSDREVLPSVLPIHLEQSPEAEARPTMLAERNRLWWLPLWGFTGVAGIILIVALVVMQQPLSNLAQAYAYAQQRMLQQADYTALDADICAGIRQVQHALTNVDVHTQDMAADAELRLGQPLQQLQASPRERPRELNLAILESKENAANWASLVNATANPTQVQAIARQVADLEVRAHDGKLIPDDHNVMARLLTRVAKQEELAGKRASQVQQLMESLEAQKLEMSLNSAERK